MSKLAPVVENLEAVPEAHREFYIKQDDGSGILDTDVEAHPGVTGLKSTLKKYKDGEKAFTAARTKLETEIADLRSKIESKEDKGQDTAQLEKVLKKKEAEIRAEFEPIVTELRDLKGGIEKRDRESVIRAAMRRAKIIADREDDAMLSADRYFGPLKDGKVAVLDDDGDPSGMTPDKFFAEKFREKKPYFYEPSGTGGSGTPAQQRQGGGGAGTVTLTPEEAGDGSKYAAALKTVGGDHSKIRIHGMDYGKVT
jgi:hypothetical protein